MSGQSAQCPGRFLSIIGRDPSVSKSNRLHVTTFGFFFVRLRNTLSIYSFKMFSNFPKVFGLQLVISPTPTGPYAITLFWSH